MMKLSWLRRLFTRPVTHTIRKAPQRCRPELEVLEDRYVPSTFIVNNTHDTLTGGVPTQGTLRWAVDQANSTAGANTIAFDNSVFATSKTITLAGPLGLSNTTGMETLTGPAAGVTVKGDGQSGVFGVDSLVTASISGLTITGGFGHGGGVTNGGTLTMSNSTVSDNSYTGYGVEGGGVFNSGTLTMSNCTVSGNSATGFYGADCGGVFNSGTATLTNCTISGNSADGEHGGAGGGGMINSGTAMLTNCTISGNSASSYYSSSSGAGVINGGTLTLTNTIVAGNTAGTGPDGDAYGGAIFNAGALTINNSTFSNNLAAGGASQIGTTVIGYNGTGGGIYMSAGTLSINSSTLAGNAAAGGGGGHPSSASTGSTSGQGGNGQGGGVYIAGGTVSINNSTLADNQAIPGSVYGGIPGDGYGGGIDNTAGPSALQMYDTILADNSANTAGPDLDGSVTSLGNNLIGNSTGGSGFAASDLVNVDPQLGPLQNNGGPTLTMALLPGSPAINAGDDTNAPAYDQRGPGFPRIVNGTIDIGAFEVQNGSSNLLSSFTVTGFSTTITAGNSGSITVTALNANGSTDTGYTGTVHFTSSDGQAGLPADYAFTATDAGVHTFTATLKTAGTQSITVSDASAGVSASEDNIAVSPAAAKTLTVSGFPSSATAGQAGTFTVTALDPYGNTAAGYTGTVHFTSSDAKASLPANYKFQASDGGVHTFSATLKTGGTQSITVTDTATASITGSKASIAVNPAAASKFIIAAPSSVNPGAAFSLTLTVEDAYGNVVTGYTGAVHFSSTDATATLPKTYTFTAADKGVHSFAGLILPKKGNQKITIAGTDDNALTGSVTVDVL